MAGLVVGVFMFAQLGEWFADVSDLPGAAIEPAAGFALAASLTFGPLIGMISTLLGVWASGFLASGSPISGLVDAILMAAQAGVGWFLIERIFKFDMEFASLRDFFVFIAGGVMISPLIPSLWQVGACLRGGGDLLVSCMGGWQAGALGVLIFGPFFVFVFRREDFRPADAEGPAELLGYSALLGGAVYLLLLPHAMEPGHYMAICSACAALAALVALRFGLRPTVLFLVVFVLLVPAYSAMFPDQARAQSAILRARDQFGSPEGIALLVVFGCLALAAYRDTLQTLRAKIALAMDAGDLCVWDWSRQGWVFHPRHWAQRFALPGRETFRGEAWEGIIPGEDLPLVREGFGKLLRREVPTWSQTYRMRQMDGSVRYVRTHATVLRVTADDEVAAVVGVTRDVTEERSAIRNEVAAMEAETELRALRSQINPHFLFNALSSVRALIGRDDERARTMVTALGKLLRTLLSERDKNAQSVEQELLLVRSYLDIEGIRFGGRLTFTIDCDESLLVRRLPGLLLLTLVENAIKHGIARLEQGGKVAIAIYRGEGTSDMYVQVTNDGTLGSGDAGCGLVNTRRRLSLATRGRGSLTIREISGPRVEVLVVVPLPEDLHAAEDVATESDPLHVFSAPLNNLSQTAP
mgnify:CR=1 FL=1